MVLLTTSISLICFIRVHFYLYNFSLSSYSIVLFLSSGAGYCDRLKSVLPNPHLLGASGVYTDIIKLDGISRMEWERQIQYILGTETILFSSIRIFKICHKIIITWGLSMYADIIYMTTIN